MTAAKKEVLPALNLLSGGRVLPKELRNVPSLLSHVLHPQAISGAHDLAYLPTAKS